MSRGLLICAHGTDDAAGQAVVASLTAQVADLLPGVDVRAAYVDVQEPTLPTAVEEAAGRHHSVVVVPLLLSYGYHVAVDVRKAVEPHPHVIARGQLGPRPLLVDVLHDRLLEAGVAPERPVVVGVAGSSRAAAAQDAEKTRRMLADRWDGPVRVGYLSAMAPTVPEVLAEMPDAAIATYLVGPGFFQRKLQRAGAHAVSAPLGDDPRLAQLLAAGYAGQRPESR